ncbi:MAG TPA: MerR family transcriptional regulator [Nocardioidaceae bacterium]|nr:MerR family transcriptional regulator [Nocardioidaceae bacterium]
MGTAKELTIDQLAGAVKMTVRNVRAYASRGLIPAPRLVGRTGYYDQDHVNRLLLIRDLLDRGYTLSAVEDALSKNSGLPAGHALDLLDTLSDPRSPEQPEPITADGLARLANVEPNSDFVDKLVEMGLVQSLDDKGNLLLLKPFVVKAGAQAVAMGLQLESVLSLLPFLSEHLDAIAHRFVDEVRTQLWRPFADAGMPSEQWPTMLNTIESLLPVASQAVVAIFRDRLNTAIDEAMGEEIGQFIQE